MAGERLLSGQMVADRLRQLILDGSLRPGERVRQEALAVDAATSRIPVREALRMLASEGLIVVRPSSGAWVAPLRLDELIELYMIRENLEPLALSLSIPQLTQEQAENIEKLHLAVEGAQAGPDFIRADREFHLATYAAAGMPLLAKMIGQLWNSTQRYRRAYVELADESAWSMIAAEHRILADSIVRRDVSTGSDIQRIHIARTRLRLQGLPIWTAEGA
jgi:DNA-binding GntR family transcriptional regulator